MVLKKCRVARRDPGGATSSYLPGYPVKQRELVYIPAAAVDASALARLQGGDYVGIYSPSPGLDVSHCGIVVQKGKKLYLRHASSNPVLQKVVDEELTAYLGRNKGLVVYRPAEHHLMTGAVR